EPRCVVALFRSSGIAEDARNRLKTEGVPGNEIALKILKPTGPIPPTVADELEALAVDPLVWGNVRDTFATFIRNGETAVLVRAATDEQVKFAADTLRQFTPIALDIVPLGAEPELVRILPEAEPSTDRAVTASKRS
ncbi:MAG: hypothetical protein JOY71_04650, partial [Acetobacteraceae bacterium]|nr:hypothetical protein [Acetobacteraceae bacterium]